MGHTEFLIGSSASPSNLPNAIADLEDASVIFMRRWASGDRARAGAISVEAMTLLDFVANEFLRIESARKGAGTFAGSAFATILAQMQGSGVSGASHTDFADLMKAGPGNGQVPATLAPVTGLDLHRLLNKVKHRNPYAMNFRDAAGRHILVLGADHTAGGPEGIYEFDVLEFCAHCRTAAAAL